jgi:hypothetical protein
MGRENRLQEGKLIKITNTELWSPLQGWARDMHLLEEQMGLSSAFHTHSTN